MIVQIDSPLSKAFLMSLTSTWEPDTLNIPSWWRPVHETQTWRYRHRIDRKSCVGLLNLKCLYFIVDTDIILTLKLATLQWQKKKKMLSCEFAVWIECDWIEKNNKHHDKSSLIHKLMTLMSQFFNESLKKTIKRSYFLYDELLLNQSAWLLKYLTNFCIWQLVVKDYHTILPMSIMRQWQKTMRFYRFLKRNTIL